MDIDIAKRDLVKIRNEEDSANTLIWLINSLHEIKWMEGGKQMLHQRSDQSIHKIAYCITQFCKAQKHSAP
jgi:hypothetical protein